MTTAEYDIFLSYAQSDDQHQKWVPKLVKAMETSFHSLTGQNLRIFVDTRGISTAKIWKEKIWHALKNSTIMVGVLAPSYFTSDWCCREWDYFTELEKTNRSTLGLTPDQGLIFPIKLIDWRRTFRLSNDQKRRIQNANQRQFISFENISPESIEFKTNVEKLVEEIISILTQIETTTSLKNKRGKMESQPRTTIGTNQQQFIQRLAQATHVTIIGITNRNLVQYLNEALEIKRSEQGANTFWLSLRIVFLSESMLYTVDDELTIEYPKREEANFHRTRIGGQAKRAISYFLIRANQPHKWRLYEYNYMLPFIGAIFEMPKGKKIVQVATLRPTYSTAEHLFLEFYGMAGEIAYYQSAFEEIIRHRDAQDEIILIGNPKSQRGSGFICTHSRFRRSVLMQSTSGNDWIAAVVIMLWREEDGKAWPMMQIRTSENATRELDMLSNISGYINQQDCYEFDKGETSEFLIQESAYENAVYRELGEELGIKEYKWPRPELIKEIRFYYPDLENLYFYLCQVKVNIPLHRIDPISQMRQWHFHDIVKVREYQVLSKAYDLLNLKESQRRSFHVASTILAYNLVLHRRSDFDKHLITAIQSGEDCQSLRKDIKELMNDCRFSYEFKGQKKTIKGLAGLQYREFFSSLVPAYANIGVEGAQDYLNWIRMDKDANTALSQLQKYYGNETSIRDAVIDV